MSFLSFIHWSYWYVWIKSGPFEKKKKLKNLLYIYETNVLVTKVYIYIYRGEATCEGGGGGGKFLNFFFTI